MSDSDFNTAPASDGNGDQIPTTHDGDATIRPPFYADGTGQMQTPVYRNDGAGISPAEVNQPQPEAPVQGYTGYQPPVDYQTPQHYSAPGSYEPPSTYAPYQGNYQPPQTYAQPTPYGSPSQYGTAAEYGYGPQATAPASASASHAPRMRTTLVGVAALAALFGAGAGAGVVGLTDGHKKSVASGITVTTKTAQNSAVITDNTVAGAAKKITPSVVTIQVSGSSESGTGSGVVMNTSGDILTNDHVVSVAGTGGTIVVQTSDGRSAPATIVGVDASDDLAVVKVSLTNLTPATFADSSAITVGQQVVAVGAPLGLSDTVTSGIVSATKRTVRSGDNDQAVFAAVQTDAAINPGNSGGALVDLNGSVIGINAAIATTGSSGVTVPGQQATQSGSIGIGFAIPSDEAGRIAAELIATGKATHAAIGVELPEDTSSTTTTTTVNGATLGVVTAGGPAASAGLKAGDVVTAVGSDRISGSDDLIAAIRAYSPGASVQITYTRSGASHTVTVKTISAS